MTAPQIPSNLGEFSRKTSADFDTIIELEKNLIYDVLGIKGAAAKAAVIFYGDIDFRPINDFIRGLAYLHTVKPDILKMHISDTPNVEKFALRLLKNSQSVREARSRNLMMLAANGLLHVCGVNAKDSGYEKVIEKIQAESTPIDIKELHIKYTGEVPMVYLKYFLEAIKLLMSNDDYEELLLQAFDLYSDYYKVVVKYEQDLREAQGN